MTGRYGYTAADELAVGDKVAYVKHYGFGSGAKVRLGGTVSKITKTRVVVEFKRNPGTSGQPEVFADRWVVNNRGELRVREGAYGSYHEPHIFLADSEEVAAAKASNDKVKVARELQAAANKVGATRQPNDEDVAALEAALAAFKASKGGE